MTEDDTVEIMAILAVYGHQQHADRVRAWWHEHQALEQQLNAYRATQPPDPYHLHND